MLKRWATLPQGTTRWLAGGLAAVVLALAIIWLLFVPAADWLAHHDVGSVTGSLHETALDNARGRLLTLGAGLFAAGALIFTARNFTLSREGQVTDRYTKAIDQLGSKELDVRIGGIYALERVARDSAPDHPTVIEVLAAFIREHSREPWPAPEPDRSPERAHSFPRPDVQAALTVIGRRNVRHDRQDIDLTAAVLPGALLSGADLSRVRLVDADLSHAVADRSKLTGARLGNATLTGASLAGATLTGATLAGAHLDDAHLTGADLTGANLVRTILDGAILSHANLFGAALTGASLIRTNLDGAHLVGADLTDADLTGAWLTANLGGAYLTRANLTGAILIKATLAGANLGGAHLTGANLTGADLTGAHLVGADLTGAALTRANLAGVRWPGDTPVPDGWKLDPGSGLLERASTGSEPTQAN